MIQRILACIHVLLALLNGMIGVLADSVSISIFGAILMLSAVVFALLALEEKR